MPVAVLVMPAGRGSVRPIDVPNDAHDRRKVTAKLAGDALPVLDLDDRQLAVLLGVEPVGMQLVDRAHGDEADRCQLPDARSSGRNRIGILTIIRTPRRYRGLPLLSTSGG